MIVARMGTARRLSRICLAVAVLSAAGCSRAPVPVPEFVKPYRMTIQQGNFVTRDMVEQLKPGMTKEQVRFILGTPLVTDMFHADRWDYTFYLDPPGGKREQRTFSVIFQDSKLSRVVGDLLPEPGAPGRPAAAAPGATEPARPISAPPKDERGFFGRLFGPSTPPAPKPAAPAEPAKPAAEPGFFGRLFTPSPAEAAPEEQKQQEVQNWGTAPQPEPAPAPPPAKAEEKPEAKPGFFGRLFGRGAAAGAEAAPAKSEEK
jgi:outer membrane protein assembly factor BamE